MDGEKRRGRIFQGRGDLNMDSVGHKKMDRETMEIDAVYKESAECERVSIFRAL